MIPRYLVAPGSGRPLSSEAVVRRPARPSPGANHLGRTAATYIRSNVQAKSLMALVAVQGVEERNVTSNCRQTE